MLSVVSGRDTLASFAPSSKFYWELESLRKLSGDPFKDWEEEEF